MAVAAGTRAAPMRIGVAIAAALVLLSGCVAGTHQIAPLPGNDRAPTTTTVQLDNRTALLYAPASRSSGTPALVVALHGYTANAQDAIDFFGLRALADLRGFLVLAPQGTTDQDGKPFWNASRACCDFEDSAVDDSGYLSRLIASVTADHQIDPARVYVVGHSNGGFMAQRFACDHADQVAAIASVAGALDTDVVCEPAEPVSMVQVHGTADDTILYGGGQINGRSYTSAAATVARWRSVDGCTAAATSGARLDADAEVEGDDLTPKTWTGCGGGTAVALWTISDGDHVPALTASFTAALLDWFETAGRR